MLPEAEARLKLSALAELTGPDRLNQEQNLYDQTPFKGVLGKAVEAQGVDLAVLRGMLSRGTTSRGYASFTELTEHPNELMRHFQHTFSQARGVVNRIRERRGEPSIPPTDYQKYMSAISQVVAGLARYPGIEEYIWERVRNGEGVYKTDGWSTAKNITWSCISYLQWAKENFLESAPSPMRRIPVRHKSATAESELKEIDPVAKVAELGEVPPTLTAGQNFLDQPPFDTVLRHLAASSRLSLDNLRTAFLRAFRSRVISETDSGRYLIPYPGEFNERVFSLGLLKDERPNRDIYHHTIDAALEQLAGFPGIGGYLQAKFDGGIYGLDGSWSRAGRDIPPTYPFSETYAQWIKNNLQRGANRVLWGIEEVFPEKPPDRGSRRISRRWANLRAAELVPERKR